MGTPLLIFTAITQMLYVAAHEFSVPGYWPYMFSEAGAGKGTIATLRTFSFFFNVVVHLSFGHFLSGRSVRTLFMATILALLGLSASFACMGLHPSIVGVVEAITPLRGVDAKFPVGIVAANVIEISSTAMLGVTV